MLTQRTTTASISVLAEYIHQALKDIGVDVEAANWSFDFVTDGEVALYKAFQRTFKHSKHTLCVKHLRGNIERFLNDLPVKIDAPKKRKLMNGIFGSMLDDVEGVRFYIPALIDAVSEEDYLVKWVEYARDIEVPQFAEWFKKNHEKDFLAKLIYPRRESMGLCRDLPHSNYVEAMNKMLKAVCGKYNDVR